MHPVYLAHDDRVDGTGVVLKNRDQRNQDFELKVFRLGNRMGLSKDLIVVSIVGGVGFAFLDYLIDFVQ